MATPAPDQTVAQIEGNVLAASLFPTFWLDAGALQWDTLVFYDQGLPLQMPGIAHVELVFQLATKVPKNQNTDLVIVEDIGMLPRKLKVTLKVWSLLHWIQWNVFLTSTGYNTPGRPRNAIGVGHPLAKMMNIQLVIVEKFHFNPPLTARDWGTITMDLLEVGQSVPSVQVPAVATPNQQPGGVFGSVPGLTGTGNPTIGPTGS